MIKRTPHKRSWWRGQVLAIRIFKGKAVSEALFVKDEILSTSMHLIEDCT